jgi:hypothetical protein
MTSRIDAAEDQDKKDLPQEVRGEAGSRPPAQERSPSKREFLKSVLLTGLAANLVLALPGGVNASPLGILSSSNNSSTTTAKPSALNLSRVFRFNDPKTGAPQISAFPEVDPTGETPLEIRMKHFTEIENFTFIGFVLAHETGGTTPKPISTITSLTVPDTEFQNLVNTAKKDKLTDEQLGDTLLDVGINWEHFVASTNTLLIPAMPTKITDTAMQAKIDSLDLISEALLAEINLRSIHERRGYRDGRTQGNA